MNQGRDTTKEERLAIVKDCLASGKITVRWRKSIG